MAAMPVHRLTSGERTVCGVSAGMPQAYARRPPLPGGGATVSAVLADPVPVFAREVVAVGLLLADARGELPLGLAARGDDRVKDLFGQGLVVVVLQPVLSVGVELGPPGCCAHAFSVSRNASIAAKVAAGCSSWGR